MICNAPGCRRARRAPRNGLVFGTCDDHLTLTPPAPARGSHSPLASPRSSGPRIPALVTPTPTA